MYLRSVSRSLRSCDRRSREGGKDGSPPQFDRESTADPPRPYSASAVGRPGAPYPNSRRMKADKLHKLGLTWLHVASRIRWLRGKHGGFLQVVKQRGGTLCALLSLHCLPN